MVGASFSTLSPNRGMENSTGTSNLSLSFFFCFSLRSQSFTSDNFRTPIYKQICPPRWIIIIFIEFFGFVSSSARRRCSRVHGRRRSDRRRTNRGATTRSDDDNDACSRDAAMPTTWGRTRSTTPHTAYIYVTVRAHWGVYCYLRRCFLLH